MVVWRISYNIVYTRLSWSHDMSILPGVPTSNICWSIERLNMVLKADDH